jgi:hypothetical protein
MIDFFISSAMAHGSSGGAGPADYGPLIFIPVIIGFILFIVYETRK